MSRPYKQTRSLIGVVNAHCSAEGRAHHDILRNSLEAQARNTQPSSGTVYSAVYASDGHL